MSTIASVERHRHAAPLLVALFVLEAAGLLWFRPTYLLAALAATAWAATRSILIILRPPPGLVMALDSSGSLLGSHRLGARK